MPRVEPTRVWVESVRAADVRAARSGSCRLMSNTKQSVKLATTIKC